MLAWRSEKPCCYPCLCEDSSFVRRAALMLSVSPLYETIHLSDLCLHLKPSNEVHILIKKKYWLLSALFVGKHDGIKKFVSAPKSLRLHELLKDDITGRKQQRHDCASHQLKLKKQQAPGWLHDRGSCRALEASWPFLPQTQHPPPLFTSLSPLWRLPVCLFRGIYTPLRTGQPGFLRSGPGWAAHHWPVSRGLFGVGGDAAGGGA